MNMTIEALYSKVIGSEELKAVFVAAVKEKKIAEFLKAQGCEATEAEIVEFLKSKQNAEGEVSDAELDAVSGGCNGEEAVYSVFTAGLLCAGLAIMSYSSDTPPDEWSDGKILCNDKVEVTV